MSLKALIDLANKRSEPMSAEEQARRNTEFQARMRVYNKEIDERHARMTPSEELLNRMITI
jgi:hypothetical protein